MIKCQFNVEMKLCKAINLPVVLRNLVLALLEGYQLRVLKRMLGSNG